MAIKRETSYGLVAMGLLGLWLLIGTFIATSSGQEAVEREKGFSDTGTGLLLSLSGGWEVKSVFENKAGGLVFVLVWYESKFNAHLQVCTIPKGARKARCKIFRD